MWRLSRAGGGSQPAAAQRNFLQNPPARNATFTARHHHQPRAPQAEAAPYLAWLLLVLVKAGRLWLLPVGWLLTVAWALYTFTIK